MECRTSLKRRICRFSIEGEMTASMVGELEEAIAPVISRERDVEINLSRVSEIDVAGLRLMMEVRLEACRRGGRLRFVRYSRPVVEILAEYGLSEQFFRVS